jgi:hypothetical protein
MRRVSPLGKDAASVSRRKPNLLRSHRMENSLPRLWKTRFFIGQ